MTESPRVLLSESDFSKSCAAFRESSRNISGLFAKGAACMSGLVPLRRSWCVRVRTTPKLMRFWARSRRARAKRRGNCRRHPRDRFASGIPRCVRGSPDHRLACWNLYLRRGKRSSTSVARSSTKTPNGLTVAMLKLDPAWDHLRKDPRFQGLIDKYGSQH